MVPVLCLLIQNVELWCTNQKNFKKLRNLMVPLEKNMSFNKVRRDVKPSVLDISKGAGGLHEWAGLHCIVIVE